MATGTVAAKGKPADGPCASWLAGLATKAEAVAPKVPWLVTMVPASPKVYHMSGAGTVANGHALAGDAVADAGVGMADAEGRHEMTDALAHVVSGAPKETITRPLPPVGLLWLPPTPMPAIYPGAETLPGRFEPLAEPPAADPSVQTSAEALEEPPNALLSQAPAPPNMPPPPPGPYQAALPLPPKPWPPAVGLLGPQHGLDAPVQ